MSAFAPVTSDVPAAIHEALDAVDAKDAARFASYFTPDGSFRYANAPAVKGTESIRQFVAQFFDSIRSLRHDILSMWVLGDTLFCKGEVIYERHNGSQAGPYPFFNLFRMEGEQIAEWLIYVDSSALYQG